MKKVILNFEIDRPYTNLTRPRHALIACRDREGRFLLGVKKMYPGFSRFVGGGVDVGEEPLHAASRELKEELGVALPESALVPLFELEAHANSSEREYVTNIFVYFAQLPENEVTPQDDIDGVARLRLDEFPGLVQKFESFDPNFRFNDNAEGDAGFLWKDYGKLYGPVHRIAYEEILARGL